jgi:hypothetical protein
METALQNMIQALREEIAQYGELLSLLEQQRRLLLGRCAEGLLENLRAIHAQVPLIAAVRKHREECRQDMASVSGQPESVSFHELFALAPAQYRGLLEALADEINDLRARTQQELEQNHRMLRRSIDFLRHVMTHFLMPVEEPIPTSCA